MAPLEIALVYLLFAVVGVVACRLLHLPAILGYLIAGVFLGQGGALVHDNEAAVASVAEMGVVLLMFVIGLEFNLPKLLRLKKMVFGFGMAQVLVMLLGTCWGICCCSNCWRNGSCLGTSHGKAQWCWVRPWRCRALPSLSNS